MIQSDSWSIIILAYNESETIKTVIDNVILLLKNLLIDYEIIIINDGSTDKTKDILTGSYGNMKEVKVINHEKNYGIGHSLIEAYETANKKIMGMIPGDGQFDTELLGNAIQLFQKDEDLKLVSFYRDSNTIYSPIRRTVSKVQKIINSYVLDIHFRDVNWVKFFRSEILGKREFCMSSSLIETEIIYVTILKSYRYIELPSIYLSRSNVRSKFSFIKSLVRASKDMFNLIKLRRFYKNKEF